MANLKQLKFTLDSLGIESNNVDVAISALENLSGALNDVPVKGREAVDQMLGCMMGIDEILGNNEQKNSGRYR